MTPNPPTTSELADALFEIGMLETWRLESIERHILPEADVIDLYALRRRTECIVLAHERMRRLARQEAALRRGPAHG